MSHEIIRHLKELKLHGMAQSWLEMVGQTRLAEFDPVSFMTQLLRSESAERAVRSIAYQMTAARFPAHRDLQGFDFTESKVDENLVRQLHTLSFPDAAHNLVFIEGPGTSKSHLATALGSRQLANMASGCASTPLSSSSMRWNWRRLPASRGRLRTGSCMPIW